MYSPFYYSYSYRIDIIRSMGFCNSYFKRLCQIIGIVYLSFPDEPTSIYRVNISP